MNAKQLAKYLTRRTGKNIRPSSSHEGWHFQFGYAHLYMPGNTVRVLTPIDIHNELSEPVEGVTVTVKYRIEGTEETQKMSIALDSMEWADKVVALAKKVFESGRTVECGPGVGLDKILGAVPEVICYGDTRLDRIVSFLYPEGEPPADLELDYQHEFHWESRQSSEFVGFMLQTGLQPLIFINRPRARCADPQDEIIDGKQRLRAMYQWVIGDIPAIVDGKRYFFYNTNEIERRMLPTFKVAYVDLTREQRLRFYIALNRGNTPHTDRKILRAQELLDKERDQETEMNCSPKLTQTSQGD